MICIACFKFFWKEDRFPISNVTLNFWIYFDLMQWKNEFQNEHRNQMHVFIVTFQVLNVYSYDNYIYSNHFLGIFCLCSSFSLNSFRQLMFTWKFFFLFRIDIAFYVIGNPKISSESTLMHTAHIYTIAKMSMGYYDFFYLIRHRHFCLCIHVLHINNKQAHIFSFIYQLSVVIRLSHIWSQNKFVDLVLLLGGVVYLNGTTVLLIYRYYHSVFLVFVYGFCLIQT